MASHGGTISIDADQLATTLVSGPIGGVVGARWLADEIGLRNVLCTDIGGTSFDMALLVNRRYEVTTTPDIARFMLNMPLVQMDSVGAGCGSFVRIDPNARRPEIGPDSAGADGRHRLARGRRRDGLDHRPQPRARAAEPRLLPRRAGQARRRARPPRGRAPGRRHRSGSGVEKAAAGVIELFETSLRNEAVGRILGKGY